MIVVYDNVSHNVSIINPNGSIPGWDSAATWNREHTWPKSRGVGSSGADTSDLHQLRPSFTQTNSNRGNLSFGGAYGQSFGVKSDQGATVWYPGDVDAGRIARQQFYMHTRYDGSDSSTSNLTLVDSGNPGSNQLGDLSRMLEWHYQAAPDAFELGRNQKVYGFQNNRNPFIDRPEYVWSVFVGQQNNAQLALAGGSTQADGSSSVSLDFGEVIVGAALPAAQAVTLDKTGSAGTYYSVATNSAGVTACLCGRHNAFAMNTHGWGSITVGVAGSTATPGTLGGTVTVDNLDVTTGLGSGFGALDGDDTIDVSLAVLDHANASFVSSGDANTLTLDFGQVVFGGVAAALDFSVFNDAAASGLFTAGLDLDGVTGAGDTSVLTTDLGVFQALGAGQGAAFSAMLNTQATGTFSATYTLSTSDENLAGATAGDALTLTLLAEVLEQAGITGDYNGSGQVEQGDLDLVLQNWGLDTSGAGVPAGWVNDNDQLGQIEQTELDRVLQNWGSTSAPDFAGSSVPEPAALGVLFLLGGLSRSRRVA